MNTTAELDAEMRNLLARMACLSYGTTQSWNTQGGGGDQEGRDPRPPGGGKTLHEYWARKYNQAVDNAERDAVIGHARAALAEESRQAPAARPTGETREQEAKRKSARVLTLHADGGWTTIDMANDTGLTIGQVRSILAAVALSAPAEERDEPRAIQMYLEGIPLRRIEQATKVPMQTVRRLGKKAQSKAA